MFRSIRTIVESCTRAVDRLRAPKADPVLQFLLEALPLLPSVVQALKPSVPVDLDGPRVKQVHLDFAAAQARLQADFTANRAQLVADYGPRFVAARASDDEAQEASNYGPRFDAARASDGEAQEASNVNIPGEGAA